MRRRTLLRGTAGASLGLFAGCTGSGPGVDGTDEPTDPSTDATPTPTLSATPCQPKITSTALAVESVVCGIGENAADASVSPTGDATPDADGNPPTYTVTVTGTIRGSDTCHRARLVDAEPASDEDTLRVVVESYVPQSNETVACGECIVDIDYEATVELACDYYGVVAVVHNDEQVAEIPLPE
ncbi:hypothetical protein [Halorarius litoreus]|uniref:hypothetical protein n=1 Tax=Halorarius litoreus TaxID=2962676 RepID=UPI0020CF452D|nr:hypothetical protein [Halorarius litoreus]